MSSRDFTVKDVKSQIQKTFDELNKRNLAILDERFSPNVIVHSAMGTDVRGLQAYKESVNQTFSTFPDIHYTLIDVLADEDKSATRYTWTGTHKGKLGGTSGNVAPTGKKVTMTVYSIARYEAGKVAEQWTMSNRLSFFQQLGVTPTLDMK